MSAVALPAGPKPRPYRRFLNSAFHTRFIHAALLSLVVSLDTAFWVSKKQGLFWSWFPLGPAGIKGLLFFMTSLFIFVLQIGTLKIGRKTTVSPISALRWMILSTDTIQTLLWYCASAFWFTEVYIWSSGDLSWVVRESASADRLNERPIYLRAYFQMLALIYAAIHLKYGLSSLHIPVSPAPTPQANNQKTHPIELIQVQLRNQVVTVGQRIVISVGMLSFLGPFIYAALLRPSFWHIHLLMLKPIFSISRADAEPSGHPYFGLLFLGRALVGGGLLALTWEATSTFFLLYMKQEPTKKGLPLTATARDPNGTLLNGLKAKRDVVKTFAFWEFALIAQQFPDRRKTIFADIERGSTTMWALMLEAALDVLRDIDTRILDPAATGSGVASPNPQVPTSLGTASVTTLTRIIPETQTQPIFAKPPITHPHRKWVGNKLRDIGSPDKPWRPPVDQAELLLEYARAPGAGNMPTKSFLEQWMTTMQRSPIGWLFTSTNAAKVNAKVLGSPQGNAALIVDAIEAITRMSVASLAEDTYGKTVSGVPETAKVFTRTITVIENFVQQNAEGVHGEIKEVEIVVSRLKAGLRELLSAFQMYLADVGLGIAQLNEAKKAGEDRHLLPQATARRAVQEKPQDDKRPQEMEEPGRPRRDYQHQKQQGSRKDNGEGNGNVRQKLNSRVR